MDGKVLRDKLVGSDEERAVSPVIGVILMVAITVILAAVIASLVMDFGASTEAPINSQVETTVDTGEVEITVLKAGSADGYVLRGPGVPGEVMITDGLLNNPDYYLNTTDTTNDPTAPITHAASGNLTASSGSAIVIGDDFAFIAGGANSGDWIAGQTVNVVAIEGDKEEPAGSFEVPEDWT